MEYVTSSDGRRIAYERTGTGPPLVLVHGSLNDHKIFGAVTPAFAERHTVLAMDRRGRGESGPTEEHTFDQQSADVVAVIDAAGEPVDLLGHSYGAHCALGAAAMVPDRVKHLVLYEPPTPGADRLNIAEDFERLSASDAVENFFANGVGVPPNQLAAMKASPFWPYLVSFVNTMPSEGRALVGHRFDPARFASLKMPVLFLQGGDTAERLGEVMRRLAPHMPQAEWHTFEGHGHGANLTAPKLFADTVLAFLAR
jgi:pimeloyl-ACP methyl ester carboxylesterase